VVVCQQATLQKGGTEMVKIHVVVLDTPRGREPKSIKAIAALEVLPKGEVDIIIVPCEIGDAGDKEIPFIRVDGEDPIFGFENIASFVYKGIKENRF
jgi:hypothetical protein